MCLFIGGGAAAAAKFDGKLKINRCVAAIEIRHISRHQILVIPSHRRRIFKTFFDFSSAQHTNAVTCSIISNYNDKKNDK